jgi:hypothetical protein
VERARKRPIDRRFSARAAARRASPPCLRSYTSMMRLKSIV